MANGFKPICIDPDNGTPSTGLGPKMEMESTSLSRTLILMEYNGSIKRKSNPNDGRGVIIFSMREFSKSVVIGFDEAVKENIPEEEFKVFKNAANKILDFINPKKYIEKKL